MESAAGGPVSPLASSSPALSALSPPYSPQCIGALRVGAPDHIASERNEGMDEELPVSAVVTHVTQSLPHGLGHSHTTAWLVAPAPAVDILAKCGKASLQMALPAAARGGERRKRGMEEFKTAQ